MAEISCLDEGQVNLGARGGIGCVGETRPSHSFFYPDLTDYKVPYDLGVSDEVHRHNLGIITRCLLDRDLASTDEVNGILSRSLNDVHARSIVPADYALVLFGYGLTLPEQRERVMKAAGDVFSEERVVAKDYWLARAVRRFQEANKRFPLCMEIARMERELEAPFESTFALSVVAFNRPLKYEGDKESISSFSGEWLSELYAEGLVNRNYR